MITSGGDFLYRPKTVREILMKSAERFKYNCAFTFLDSDGKKQEISYKNLKDDVDCLSLCLLYNLKMKDEKAALICCNCYQWCVAYLACLNTGIVCVPVDRELSGEDMGYILDFADVKAVFCDGNSLSKLKRKETVSYICVDSDDENGFMSLIEKGRRLKREGFTVEDEIDGDELAVLLFTSGTTGNPKGVMLSNNNICSDLYLVGKNIKAGESDRTLSVLPLHHTYESMAFLMMLYCGGSIAFCGGIRYLSKSFSVFSPTVFVTVPLILEKLHGKIMSEIENQGMKQKFRLACLMSSTMTDEKKKRIFSPVHKFFGGRLKKIIVGAAAVQPEIVEAFEHCGFKVIIGYGLTECSPIVICNSTEDRSADSVGRPLNEVEVRIDNPDEKGIGELWVKGPMVMKGYYKNDNATKQVFSDSWFRTGDLVCRDKNGRFYITGRCKNVIVTKNGKNIYPEELEYRLTKNPFIKECVVYGEKGDVISCEILPDEAAIKNKLKKRVLSDDDIKSVINEAVRSVNRVLPSYKRIKKVSFRKDEFTKTTTHKIKRKY